MKESLTSQAKGLIFRETGQSKQQCLINGGQPTDVVFENGVMVLNGVSSLVSYSNNTNNFESDESFTYKIKMNKDDTSINGVIVSNFTSGGTGYVIFVDNSIGSRNIGITMRSNALTASVIRVHGTIELQDGEDYTIVLTYDGSRTAAGVSIYIDGDEDISIIDSDTLSTDSMKSNENFTIGVNPYLVTYFGGRFDLIDTYNYARTAEQVENDRENKTYLDVREGLVLDFDSRQGVAKDRMGGTFTDAGNTEIVRSGNTYALRYPGTIADSIGFPDLKYTGLYDGDFSVVAFVKLNSISSIISRGTGGVSNFSSREIAIQGALRFFGYNGASWSITHTETIDPGMGVCICVTYGVNTTLYVNGVPNTTVLSNNIVAHSNPTYDKTRMRGNNDTFSANPNGDIPLIRIYNRELSKAEVMQIHTSNNFYNA